MSRAGLLIFWSFPTAYIRFLIEKSRKHKDFDALFRIDIEKPMLVSRAGLLIFFSFPTT